MMQYKRLNVSQCVSQSHWLNVLSFTKQTLVYVITSTQTKCCSASTDCLLSFFFFFFLHSVRLCCSDWCAFRVFCWIYSTSYTVHFVYFYKACWTTKWSPAGLYRYMWELIFSKIDIFTTTAVAILQWKMKIKD